MVELTKRIRTVDFDIKKFIANSRTKISIENLHFWPKSAGLKAQQLGPSHGF